MISFHTIFFFSLLLTKFQPHFSLSIDILSSQSLATYCFLGLEFLSQDSHKAVLHINQLKLPQTVFLISRRAPTFDPITLFLYFVSLLSTHHYLTFCLNIYPQFTPQLNVRHEDRNLLVTSVPVTRTVPTTQEELNE